MSDEEKLQPSVRRAAEEAGLEYDVFACDPKYADTAAFCEHYHFLPEQSANTIIVASKGEPVRYAACIVLATTRLDVNKTVRRLLGVRKLSFATADQTKELTGMQIGGVTPFGITGIPLYIDSAVMEQEKVITGGGNRSSKVLLNPKELLKLVGAEVIDGIATAPADKN
jgi:prolyl-tRNA editing enzyme YbaK/EbsC (Cys-tRNA(Pro) deacylase)